MAVMSGNFDFLSNGAQNAGGATFGESIGNWFTGNKDWERQMLMAQYSNAFSAQQAAINREWQERMSNTSYQRAVADLKAAGLNPVLVADSGGASTPSGSSASASGGGSQQSGKGFSLLGQLAMAFISLGANSALQAQKNAGAMAVQQSRNAAASALQASKMDTAKLIYDTQYLRYLTKARKK